jgi:hypothetical protein
VSFFSLSPKFIKVSPISLSATTSYYSLKMHLNRSADLASYNFTMPFWLTGFSKYGQAHNAHLDILLQFIKNSFCRVQQWYSSFVYQQLIHGIIHLCTFINKPYLILTYQMRMLTIILQLQLLQALAI